MIDKNHVSVLTPFQKAGKLLPTKSDVDRVCSFSERSFSTASFNLKKVKRDKYVEKMIQETVRSIRLANPSYGQVRERISNKGIRVDLLSNATPLSLLQKS